HQCLRWLNAHQLASSPLTRTELESIELAEDQSAGVTGILQPITRAKVWFGSFASHQCALDVCGMSAMPPILTELMRHSNTSRGANSALTRRSKQAPLFDHLVGAGGKAGWHFEIERLGSFQIDYELETS